MKDLQILFRKRLDEIVEHVLYDKKPLIMLKSPNKGEGVLDFIAHNMCEVVENGDIDS